MTRDEHLAWARARALEHLDAGDLQKAWDSMGADLSTHEELRDIAQKMRPFGRLFVSYGDAANLRRWIEGFR